MTAIAYPVLIGCVLFILCSMLVVLSASMLSSQLSQIEEENRGNEH